MSSRQSHVQSLFDGVQEKVETFVKSFNDLSVNFTESLNGVRKNIWDEDYRIRVEKQQMDDTLKDIRKFTKTMRNQRQKKKLLKLIDSPKTQLRNPPPPFIHLAVPVQIQLQNFGFTPSNHIQLSGRKVTRKYRKRKLLRMPPTAKTNDKEVSPVVIVPESQVNQPAASNVHLQTQSETSASVLSTEGTHQIRDIQSCSSLDDFLPAGNSALDALDFNDDSFRHDHTNYDDILTGDVDIVGATCTAAGLPDRQDNENLDAILVNDPLLPMFMDISDEDIPLSIYSDHQNIQLGSINRVPNKDINN